MDQFTSQNTTTNMVPGKTKNSGLATIIMICVILAVCGIGFGAYGMMQISQKDNEISDLKDQVKEASKASTVIDNRQTDDASTVDTSEQTTTTTNVDATVSGGPYIENGYFYVPKWGAKYKLSDDLTNYGYAVDQNSQGDSYGNYVVGLTAISKSDYAAHPQSTYYNDIFSCSVVTIRAMEESKQSWWGTTSADIQFNGFNFVIHDTWREENCNSDYSVPTSTVVEQLKTILSNPEKI